MDIQVQPGSVISPARLQGLLDLYTQPLQSTRSGPLYNAFSYPTKISPEAIAIFIATHTDPGATIMDPFAGSGTTGLAAKLCDRPTSAMIHMTQDLGLSPIWGPRHAILYELGYIGSFVARVMCDPPNPTLFETEAAALASDAYECLGPLLTVIGDEGRPGILRHAIWSEVLVCAHCEHEHTFWDVAVEHEPLHLRIDNETYDCPACGKELLAANAIRATEWIYDELLGHNVEQRKRVPVRIYGKTGKRKWQRSVVQSDYDVLSLIDTYPLPSSIPVSELKLGDLYRGGYHFGLTHLHHLYTRRNLISIATLLDLIEKRHESVREGLRLLVLSYNQSHATLMTRVVIKDGQSDFVLTGAQSGVLYVSSLPVEKNVIEGIMRKLKPLRDSFALVRDSSSSVVVRNQTSTLLAESSDSIDYIFTDPPFADFIPYAEINQVNELWLGKRTDDANEAIVSPAQGKSLEQYGDLMSSVFREAARVLKPTGVMTVVFHAAKANVWSTLQEAYQSAGFKVAATSVLDKLQASFKQIVSTVSVKGDPLLLLIKGSLVNPTKQLTTESLIAELVDQACKSVSASERAPSRLYARYITRCLEAGEAVNMDADEFYTIIRRVLPV